MRLLGALLIAGGVGLAVRSALLLAGRGRPRRGPQPAFVIAGPYRRMRNPLLAGLVLVVAGATVLSASLAMALVAVASAVVAHAWVVLVEEPRLALRFGAAYAAYLRRVPRWWPAGRRPSDGPAPGR
jgi:protein-S-isoprenylcysteine O-methyltransferase Ste14